MPLPENNVKWPPEEMAPFYVKMSEWAAWYSGEPDRIIDAYAGEQASSTTSTTSSPVPWWRFWSRARAWQDGQQRAQLHVPVASDLAQVSGSLLFGEPPRIRVREARDDTAKPEPSPEQVAGIEPMDDGEALERPETPEENTEQRLIEIAEEGDLYARLAEAAETSAAVGGVYIYPVWDTELRDVPIMAIAQSDQAVPEFRHGFLVAVTFWRNVARDGNVVLRHVERHEVQGTGDGRKGVVLHGLYEGGNYDLGQQRDLAMHPETADLEPIVELPFPELDVEYIPNTRPNRLWRASAIGVADIQGAESLLDALDEVYASWMRDVRLAKARILVPREYMRKDEDGNDAFDVDQEIYVPMDMEPGLSQDSRAMMAHQFQIRYLEHRETSAQLIDRIVSNAGYVPQTLGEGSMVRGGDTGTALRIAEHKTLLTLRKKSGWWRTAISNVLEHMLLIDNEVFGSGNTIVRPVVQLADSIIDNPLELAQTALALKTAESASVETRVRLVHPDWSNHEVMAEVDRIKDDAPPPPVMTPGAFGGAEEDPASTDKIPTGDQTKDPPANAPPPSPPLAKQG